MLCWVGTRAGPDALKKITIQQPSRCTEYAVLVPPKPCRPTFLKQRTVWVLVRVFVACDCINFMNRVRLPDQLSSHHSHHSIGLLLTMIINLCALHRYMKAGGPGVCRLATSYGRSDGITDDREVS